MNNKKFCRYKAAEFGQNISKKQFAVINRKIITDTLNNTEQWFINEKKFQSQKWDQIFIMTTAINAKKVIFDWNREDTVIAKIIHIDFINLKHISFSANRIVSIECLNRLKAPNLKELSLTNNLITCFRSLRKGHFPQLQILDIFHNESKQVDTLVQLHTANLFKLSIEMTTGHQVMGQDLRWAFKLQSNRVKWLWAFSRHRIVGEELEGVFCRRGVHGGLKDQKRLK